MTSNKNSFYKSNDKYIVLTGRYKVKQDDEWGTPALYKKKDCLWEKVSNDMIGRTVASFKKRIDFRRKNI